jgi:Serine carboxypeptidase S28
VCSPNVVSSHSVVKVAEEASPGCADGVKSTLQAIHEHVVSSDKASVDLAVDFGICIETFPEYIVNNDIFAQELTMLVVSSNADFNMDYYPPSDETDLVKSCRIFSDSSTSPIHRYAKFLELKQGGSDYESSSGKSCFDMTTEIAAGPNATISSADWSGAGDGETARSWEFQICRDLVVQTGFGPNSMFYPPREWTLEWLTQHCQSRFQVNPQPRRLLHMWHFDDIVSRTSRIVFTNGLKDGWSVSSYTEDLSETIVAVNFPNGAHHSDLIHEWPAPGETDDLVEGHKKIVEILHGWLNEIKS